MTVKRKQTPEQIECTRIMLSIEVETRCSINCAICGDEEFHDEITAHQFSHELHKAGWRWDASEKFQLAGVMCPDCFNKPDAQRGEG